jgi:hypothetical protein
LEAFLVDDVTVCLPLSHPNATRKIIFIAGSKLRALSARRFKATTADVVLAPSGKSIHIVKRPHHGSRHGAEECSVVEEAVNGMEVKHVCAGTPAQDISVMRRSIVVE